MYVRMMLAVCLLLVHFDSGECFGCLLLSFVKGFMVLRPSVRKKHENSIESPMHARWFTFAMRFAKLEVPIADMKTLV